MAARSPGRTFSTLRALGALAVVVLLFVGIAFFGLVITDSLDDESDNGEETETEGEADNPSTVVPGGDDTEGDNVTETDQSNSSG